MKHIDMNPDVHGGMHSEAQVVATGVKMQEQSAHMTTAFDPRAKAQLAINEIASMAQQSMLLASTLSDATGKLTAQAEATKCAAVIASDKIKSAYDRMAKIDIEKMMRYADAAERLVAALTHLEQLDRNGKLKALFDTLKEAK